MKAKITSEVRRKFRTDIKRIVNRARREDPEWDEFRVYITPWFEKEFEEPLKRLLAETRVYYRRDPIFREAVRAGDKRRAKNELKELLGVISC